MGKSDTDFGKTCYRLWGNLSLTLGKSATDFGEAPFLGKTCSVFGMNGLCFWEKTARFAGEIGLVFGLAWEKTQVSLFRKVSMFGFGIFKVLGLGVSENKPVGNWEGKLLKPIKTLISRPFWGLC